jgi:DNA-directed RNA polymerase specialized sigma24 family protein
MDVSVVQPLNDDKRRYVEEIYLETYEKQRRYCMRLTSNDDDADDMTQEAYLRLTERVIEMGEVEDGLRYLMGIAKNLKRSDYRKSQQTKHKVNLVSYSDFVGGEIRNSESLDENSDNHVGNPAFKFERLKPRIIWCEALGCVDAQKLNCST